MNNSSHIKMLGTGSAMCTRCYNTCFVLKSPQGQLMVDAGGGNGIFRQLFRAGVEVTSLRHLFVTHVHTDHIMGVIWLIRRISPMQHKGYYRGDFTIYCHREVKEALLTMCRLMIPEKILQAVGRTIIIREVTDGETIAIDDMTVTFFDLHSPKVLQFGFQAVMPGGERVVCLGDEPFYPESERYVRDCDWLLCEAYCMHRDRDRFKPYEKQHSTVVDAATFAQRMNVKNLLLYHTEDTRLASRRINYSAEAATVFHGNIHVPDDLETVNL